MGKATEPIRVTLATAVNPGAVAILQLRGPGCAGVLEKLTGLAGWQPSRLRHARFGELDDGLAGLIGQCSAQVMPHGGPRVVRKLIDQLVELGCTYDNDPPAPTMYPEAASDLEADMLATLATAASPAAVDWLLAQPRLWSESLLLWEKVAAASRPGEGVSNRNLDHLLAPPTVVVVGRPNVGKSTLTNRMLGRDASIVADQPGTTRDWVSGLAEINSVAVRWLDTPGLRDSDDPVEQQAIAMARTVIAAADVLIVMRDATLDWPERETLPREPDLWIVNKCDQVPPPTPASPPAHTRLSGYGPPPLSISAATGAGVDALHRAVLERLGLDDLAKPRPWAFSPALRDLVARGDVVGLRHYTGQKP